MEHDNIIFYLEDMLDDMDRDFIEDERTALRAAVEELKELKAYKDRVEWFYKENDERVRKEYEEKGEAQLAHVLRWQALHDATGRTESVFSP